MTDRSDARWFGDRAVVVTPADPADAAALAIGLAAAMPAYEVRVGMVSVLVEAVEPDPTLLDAVRVAAIDIPARRAVAESGPTRDVVVPMVYDGSDLEVVASVLGCSSARVVAAHREQDWQVAMMGFAPGFGYLVPVGPPLLDWHRIDRRSDPRTRVPQGSVAVAAGMSAVYPAPMPGGWHLIGRTMVRLFDVDRVDDPTLLHPGDLVRFVVEPA